MADNDKIFGSIIALIGLFGIIAEFIVLILQPLQDKNVLGGLNPGQWWAIAIPFYIGLAAVLGIVMWIGYTMAVTPPPEAWDFDDLEEELEEEKQSGTQSAKKEKKNSIEQIDGVTAANKVNLEEAGFDTIEKIANSTAEDLVKVKGIGKASATKIIDSAKSMS